MGWHHGLMHGVYLEPGRRLRVSFVRGEQIAPELVLQRTRDCSLQCRRLELSALSRLSHIADCHNVCQTLKDLLVFLPEPVQLRTFLFCAIYKSNHYYSYYYYYTAVQLTGT